MKNQYLLCIVEQVRLNHSLFITEKKHYKTIASKYFNDIKDVDSYIEKNQDKTFVVYKRNETTKQFEAILDERF